MDTFCHSAFCMGLVREIVLVQTIQVTLGETATAIGNSDYMIFEYVDSDLAHQQTRS